MELWKRRRVYLAKFRQADAHLQVLRNSIQRFVEEDAHRVIVDLYSEEGIAEVTGGVIGSPHRIESWGLRLGDCIHNYRATLDYLVHQLACLKYRTPPNTEFPIYHKPGKFQADGKRKIACLDPADQARIEELQPYDPLRGMPTSPKRHPLWLLNEMDVADKHRLLNVTAVVANYRKLTPRPHDIDIVRAKEFPAAGVDTSDVIARYKIKQTGSKPKLDVEVEGSFRVVLGQGTVAPNEELLAILDAIRETVGGILVDFGDRFANP